MPQTRTMPIDKQVDLTVHPKHGGNPVALTDLHWTSGDSGLLVTPNADGTVCRVHADPAVDPSALLGHDIQVAVSGGGKVDWVTFTLTASAPTADDLGLTVGEPFGL